ncbi:MAG TPA: hypothetical protein VLC09_00390, partial [Polyangiaceae bacterium]|nr:hypothetical protein [Polyangiaceae bacterium]
TSVPVPLAQLVARLLEKAPEARPASALELADELSRIGSELGYGWPISPTSAGLRAQRGSHPDTSVRKLGLGSRVATLWVPGLALLVGLGLGGFFMLRALRHDSGAASEPSADPLEQIEVEARAGDRDALGELRRLLETEKSRPMTGRPAAELAEARARSSGRYLALGRGYSVIKHYPAALDAYRAAVEADPHLAEEPDLLVDVRVALEQRDATESGIDFALGSLGAAGADLVFDVWQDGRGKPGMTPVVARAQKRIKDREFRALATPPLQFALDLERAQACAEYRALLPEAILYADQRSAQKLEALRVRTGCGSTRHQDCFVCLRAADVPLEAAINAANSRPPPKFLGAE